MAKKAKDICESCVRGPYDKCNESFEQLSFDAVTRTVAECKSYEEKPKHHIKITYECDDMIAVEEKDVYDMPKLKWRTGLGEFKNVIISEDELEKLKRDYPHEYQDGIEALSEYIMISPEKAKKYKSHYAVVRKWINGDRKKRREREQEAKARESHRANRDKLTSQPTYDLNKIKQDALNNTEL